MKPLPVIIVADVDISRLSGDTGRTLAFGIGLKNKGYDITLVVPKPNKNEFMLDCSNIKIHFGSINQTDKSFINILKRRYALIQNVKKILTPDSILIIETSTLGGYFSVFGFKNFILDVHGIAFDEVDYATFPWYAPKSIYKKFIYFLEKRATQNARKIITVSKIMSQFIIDEWNVEKNKIEIIPNGFFLNIVDQTNNTKKEEEQGRICFIGLSTKWGNIEKIIRVASKFNKDEANFYIVGGASPGYFDEITNLSKTLGVQNIFFLGSLPIENVYKIIQQSQIVLLPFPKTICTDVACPIKVLEYMAFGKAMVLDNVSEISQFLGENDAALICDPDNENEFENNIRLLLLDSVLRKRIGNNARILSKLYSWDEQCNKLINILESQK